MENSSLTNNLSLLCSFSCLETCLGAKGTVQKPDKSIPMLSKLVSNSVFISDPVDLD